MPPKELEELAAKLTLADLVRLNEAVLRAAWPAATKIAIVGQVPKCNDFVIPVTSQATDADPSRG